MHPDERKIRSDPVARTHSPHADVRRLIGSLTGTCHDAPAKAGTTNKALGNPQIDARNGA